MTYEQWERVTEILAGLYPAAPSSPQTMLVWFQELEHLDADVAENAIRVHARASKWPPSLAEVLELAGPNQEVRDFYAQLPDFTGFDKLSEGEQLERLEAGCEASNAVNAQVADRIRETTPGRKRVAAKALGDGS